MNQLLLGAALPFLCGLAFYLGKKGRASLKLLIALPVAMTVSMLWAVAPDLPRLFGMSKLYHKLAFDPRCNIFYWHYSIDKIETESNLYLFGFVVLLALLLTAAWRELHLQEKEN